MKKHFFSLILLIFSFLFNFTYPQSFTTTPFITMPGDNMDLDVTCNVFNYGNPAKAFICWVNKFDSVYSLYLKQTTSANNENILIYSGTSQITNPKIAFVTNSYYNKVRIVWQSFNNNHWQILSRIYSGDTLTNIVALTDSLTDNVTPALCETTVAWIQNGNLYYNSIDSTGAGNYILDSTDCSNPSIIDLYSGSYPIIAYEKGLTGNKQIFEASYNRYSYSQWVTDRITNDGNNIKPRLNFLSGQPSFETYYNGVWKVTYNFSHGDTTDNISYNCENPIAYANNIITKSSIYSTRYFIVYDSDSLKNNKEIIFRTYDFPFTTMNISNAVGDDYLPYISF